MASWVKFQSAQRAFMNYVELFPILIVFSIVSGLYFPVYAIVGVWAMLIGRIIYAIGYVKQPKLRTIGGMLAMPFLMMMMILSWISAVWYITHQSVAV